MSNTDVIPSFAGQQGGAQGSGGITDVVTQLNGIARNISNNGMNLLNLIAALQGRSLASYTVATLPSNPSIGNMAVVTDGTAALTWGSVITGGHSTPYLVWWTGAAWHVFAS